MTTLQALPTVADTLVTVEKGPTPTAPVPVVGFKTPKNALLTIVKAGMAKGDMSFTNIAIMGLLAGIFIGFSGLLVAVTAGGMTPGPTDPAYKTSIGYLSPGLVKLVAGAVFPVGLMMIVVTGGELFTGNVMYLTAALLARKSTWQKLLKSWVVSYVANFAGCVTMAYFGTFLCESLDKDPYHAYIIKTAHTKVWDAGWGAVLLKGIGANWLVCLALFLALASESFEGKIVGIWWPIMTFVAIGYEHCVANMYTIITGLMYVGTDTSSVYYFTFGDFIAKNLIPATIGNIIGGAVFVGAVYFYVYREHTHLAIASMKLTQGKHRRHLFGRRSVAQAHPDELVKLSDVRIAYTSPVPATSTTVSTSDTAMFDASAPPAGTRLSKV